MPTNIAADTRSGRSGGFAAPGDAGPWSQSIDLRPPPPDPRFSDGQQAREKFESLWPLLGDPLTHQPLRIAKPLDARGDGWIASAEREYLVRGWIPYLNPDSKDLLERHGRRKLAAWREVQAEGERSYLEDGPIGNFSHAGWSPAVETGELLARVFGGLDRPWVLDVGCGLLAEPAYQSAASAAGVRFVGLDPMVGHEERKAPFVVGFGDHLPFQRGALDGVCFISSLDHLIDPCRALRDARQLLRREGILVIEETMRPADRDYWRWYWRSFLRPTRFNRFHNFAFRPGSLLRLIRRAGFTRLETHVTSDPRELCVVARKA